MKPTSIKLRNCKNCIRFVIKYIQLDKNLEIILKSHSKSNCKNGMKKIASVWDVRKKIDKKCYTNWNPCKFWILSPFGSRSLFFIPNIYISVNHLNIINYSPEFIIQVVYNKNSYKPNSNNKNAKIPQTP